MARENTVILHGQVLRKPEFYVKNGKLNRGSIIVKTLRRTNGTGGYAGSKLYFDCPIVLTRNEDMFRKLYVLEVGDMVDIKGALSTKEVLKSSLCPHCQAKNVTQGNTVFVTPIFIEKRESTLSVEDGLRTLKERSEISNLITVIGTLCRDPGYYQDEKGRDYAQYQLAVNRRLRIREDNPDIKTDYPWVKTFGQQALNDSRALRQGSVVYITGAVQTRDIARTSVCVSCGKSYNWEERVTEIVPYSTEYLSGCVIPEEASNAEEVEIE